MLPCGTACSSSKVLITLPLQTLSDKKLNIKLGNRPLRPKLCSLSFLHSFTSFFKIEKDWDAMLFFDESIMNKRFWTNQMIVYTVISPKVRLDFNDQIVWFQDPNQSVVNSSLHCFTKADCQRNRSAICRFCVVFIWGFDTGMIKALFQSFGNLPVIQLWF